MLSRRCIGQIYTIRCFLSDILGVVQKRLLTLKAPITIKFVRFCRLLKCLNASMANSVDPDQTAPIGAVCSGSTLFASILIFSVMLGNYLQQTTAADAFFLVL